MSLTELNLNLGERQIVSIILNQIKVADLATSRNARHIQRALDLRQAEHAAKRIGERLGDLELGGLAWEVLVDPSYLADDVRSAIKDDFSEDVRGSFEALAKDVEAVMKEQPFRLDSDFVAWLIEQAKEVDLARAAIQTREGRKEIKVTVPVAQMELLADLADKLTGTA